MSSNVDDLLYAHLPGSKGQKAMEGILETFGKDNEDVGDFRYCGKEVHQDEEFGIIQSGLLFWVTRNHCLSQTGYGNESP